jgi:hypothetical protein
MGPNKYQASSGSKCIYNEVDSKEFILTDLMKQYVTNDFFYDPGVESLFQNNKNHYKALQSQNFKILETGLITADGISARKSFLQKYRYDDVVLDGELYVLDNSFSTKIITEDCTIFYLSLKGNLKSLQSSILLANGSGISDADLFQILGKEALKKETLEASINYDRFEKVFKVRTPMFEEKFLRGAVSENSQDISYIQLYLDVLFLGEWGFINNAIDTDGNFHEVTKISSDVDSHSFGTSLTETVGVTLYREFLEKHKDGFELKLVGKQERIINIYGTMVKSFWSIPENLDKMLRPT